MPDTQPREPDPDQAEAADAAADRVGENDPDKPGIETTSSVGADGSTFEPEEDPQAFD